MCLESAYFQTADYLSDSVQSSNTYSVLAV